MFVWRDKKGRITSVTGSVHEATLAYLEAEDEFKSKPKVKAAPKEPEPAKPEPLKPEPAKPPVEKKGVSHGDNDKTG